MQKTDLRNVTLVCADCVDVARAIRALEHSRALCDFGAVKLLTSLETAYPEASKIVPLRSLNDYSAFCLKELYKHIDTPYMLTVQHDGWVLNPDAWNSSWFQYDYIGPLYLQEVDVNAWSVGSGGFSFRSTSFMAKVSSVLPDWNGTTSYDNPSDGKNYWAHEDGVVTKYLRPTMEALGYKYATPRDASLFAFGGNPNPNYYCKRPFGFHGFHDVTLDGYSDIHAGFPTR